MTSDWMRRSPHLSRSGRRRRTSPRSFTARAPDQLRLTPEIESQLYRIVQEALNNVSKHARATRQCRYCSNGAATT